MLVLVALRRVIWNMGDLLEDLAVVQGKRRRTCVSDRE